MSCNELYSTRVDCISVRSSSLLAIVIININRKVLSIKTTYWILVYADKYNKLRQNNNNNTITTIAHGNAWPMYTITIITTTYSASKGLDVQSPGDL